MGVGKSEINSNLTFMQKAALVFVVNVAAVATIGVYTWKDAVLNIVLTLITTRKRQTTIIRVIVVNALWIAGIILIEIWLEYKGVNL